MVNVSTRFRERNLTKSSAQFEKYGLTCVVMEEAGVWLGSVECQSRRLLCHAFLSLARAVQPPWASRYSAKRHGKVSAKKNTNNTESKGGKFKGQSPLCQPAHLRS